VGADVRNAFDADHAACVITRAAADARDERVASGKPRDLRRRLGGHVCLFRTLLDRGEDSVDVEQDRRALGLSRQARQQCVGLHASYDRGVRLVLIGLAVGFFSALFGVGGGIIVVPLLILFLRYAGREAMATSLAAIGLIALAGVVTYAFHDEVRPAHAVLLGVPAAFGAVAGATLQQRLSNRSLAFAFAALLAGVGITLLV
jgi:uncharacterized membrane protein YfcA